MGVTWGARAQSRGACDSRALDLSRKSGGRSSPRPSPRPGRVAACYDVENLLVLVRKKRYHKNAHAALVFLTGLKYKESLRALLSAISEPSEKARPQYFAFFRSQSRPTK